MSAAISFYINNNTDRFRISATNEMNEGFQWIKWYQNVNKRWISCIDKNMRLCTYRGSRCRIDRVKNFLFLTWLAYGVRAGRGGYIIIVYLLSYLSIQCYPFEIKQSSKIHAHFCTVGLSNSWHWVLALECQPWTLKIYHCHLLLGCSFNKIFWNALDYSRTSSLVFILKIRLKNIQLL